MRGLGNDAGSRTTSAFVSPPLNGRVKSFRSQVGFSGPRKYRLMNETLQGNLVFRECFASTCALLSHVEALFFLFFLLATCRRKSLERRALSPLPCNVRFGGVEATRTRAQ